MQDLITFTLKLQACISYAVKHFKVQSQVWPVPLVIGQITLSITNN